MVGKEIVRFHTIYWPIFCKALGIEPPKQVFGHGWLLMKDGKMSKSKGNVVYPEMLIERYGLDAVRYYLMRAISFGQDGIFTPEDFVGRINFDLANDLGNLLNRTVSMINKYNDGKIEATGVSTEFDASLEEVVEETISHFHKAMDKFEFNVALADVWTLISRTNKYIDETAPWVLAKSEDDKAKLNNVLYHLAENLRIAGALLQPFMRATSGKIFEQLGMDERSFSLENLSFGYSFTHPVVAKGQPIFPRLDVEEEVAYIQLQMAGGSADSAEVADEWVPEEVELNLTLPQIKFDDFEKIELKVAEVLEVESVEGSDKLLRFKLDAGDSEPRQILSGIAQFYPNEQELVGKKLQIVANLKPRKMMKKYVSQGMILSAEFEEQLRVLTVDDDVPAGSLIG
ncbi:Methionine--tRNA ligase [Lactococcus lactis]|nr:Methionine--tRNA ligase [Lactococcus lactis]